MSRPLSRKGSAKGKQPKKKTPKQQIAELTEQNSSLTAELEALRLESSELKVRLDAVTNKLVSSVKLKDFGLDEQGDPGKLSNETLVDIIENLLVRKQVHEVSVEERVEKLESRVTEMTLALAKMTTKNTAYENGLQDIVNSNDNMDSVKDKIYKLLLIAGQEFHTFSANDPKKTHKDVLNGYHDTNPSAQVRKSLENAHLLNLHTPNRKLPGETPIRNMNKDLKMFVMQELSQEKASGGDWRRMAERVGVPDSDTTEWKSQKLQYPMGRVLDTWSASPSATVRMLHRHLVSPQMRCTLVAKRVSDYYEID